VSGVGEQELHTNFEEAFRYLETHTEVRDVLLSGGDALIFSDDKIDKLLSRLRSIKHIEFVRIGTRVPIFLPQRITPELCALLAKHHPLWMSVHVNHPRELTIEVKEALERLANAGIPLGNQSVLLAGVNDDLETMKTLVHKLLICRVRPYYIYQCDLINGSSHLRTSVAKGIEIIEGLRGHTTGYAVPQFVIDAPGGGGKVPKNRDSQLRRQNLRVPGNWKRERPVCASARVSRRVSLFLIVCHSERSAAESRMERLGKPRHRREGRRLSEREVSESNLLLSLDVQRCLHFGRHDKSMETGACSSRRFACGTLFRNFFSWRGVV